MRSLLFVPGDDLKKLSRSLRDDTEADALIFDLEDSVALARKDDARRITCDALGLDTTKRRFVRLNPFDTGRLHEDLAATLPGNPDGFVLPKATGVQAVARLGRLMDQAGADPRCSIIVIASETPVAVQALARDDWGHPRLEGMMWGAEDLAAELGASRNRVEGRPTQPFRLALNLMLVAAKAAGVLAVDTVYADFRDQAGLRAEAEEAAADGFDAKAAIHPAQLAPINQAFTPTAEAVAWARAVVAVMSEASTGVASLDGQMLDQPHLKQAHRILTRANDDR
ncbi:MAG: CoA ester lyase [Geminicoccus sp.]|nr:CoA ester lyase [Geminicoccus sp.]